MKKFKIIGGVVFGVVACNVGFMWYFDIGRHINDIVTEEETDLTISRKSIHQILTLAVERALNEKYGPV